MLRIDAPRILDFDIENRPLSYFGGDLTTSEITAIAAGWADEPDEDIQVVLLGEADPIEILEWFTLLYDQADIVTGHYIRMHDLPIINGSMVEYGVPTLEPKMTIDTKLDLIRWNFQAQPKSQAALGEALGIESPKIGMSQAMWRDANRLTREGLDKTATRVVGDVKQHKELRLELTRRGLLGKPRVWAP